MYKITIHILSLTLLLLPSVVFGKVNPETEAATNFVPLVGIPYIEGEKVSTFGDYVNAFYYASISIAAFLAVIRIIFAGVKYMLTDIVTKKGDAKNDIRSALFGLLIVVGAVLILNTINTNLTQIRLFADAPVPNMVGKTEKVVPTTPTPTIGSSINSCEHTTNYNNSFRTGCPGNITAERDPNNNSCQIISCINPVPYIGPESCAADETLVVDSSSLPVVRSCIPGDPTPEVPGVNIDEEVMTIPCTISTACSYPTDMGYRAGIASMTETCNLRGDMIEFRVTGNGVGICYYVE